MRLIRGMAFVLAVWSSVGVAEARQTPAEQDPVATAPIRIGVVALDPRFRVTDLGVDSNVFNTIDFPQRDQTMTFVPGTDLWLRTGRGLLTLSGNMEFVYFRRFETERSINSSATGRYELRFNRLSPFATFATLNTKQRPGYEIDVRARRYETQLSVGTAVRAFSKSTARISARHHTFTFAGDQLFAGRALNQGLNRSLNAIDLGWQHRLTALTTWMTQVSYERERFAFESERDSNSLRISTGFDLSQFALIRGSALVGFRRLSPSEGSVIPPFKGITADMDVAYTAPTQTRLGLEINRDVQYSYDITTPFYLQTSWTARVTQRVIGRWDVEVTGGRDRLGYRNQTQPASGRTDFIGRWGGGVGYTVGQQVRVSFDVLSYYRSSEIPGREYGATRAGFSVNYGY